jgi:hypothetical protein
MAPSLNPSFLNWAVSGAASMTKSVTEPSSTASSTPQDSS